MAKKPLRMSVKIDDRDQGMEKFIAEADDDTDSVDIGVLADEDAILVIYAASNEFGTRDGHIPERSFIRAGVDENDAAINDVSREFGRSAFKRDAHAVHDRTHGLP